MGGQDSDAVVRMGKKLIRWSGLALVLAVSASIYSTTLDYEFSWDDELFLLQSQRMAELESIPRAFTTDFWGLTDSPSAPKGSPLYRPLALGFVILERSLFGGDPACFRFVHSCWHLFNIALIFLLSRRLLNGGPTTEKPTLWGPSCAAATFAALPYTVDTVLFLMNICDLMALFFILLAALAFLAWLDRPRRWYLIAVFVASGAAALSKESAVVSPLLLAAIYWCRRQENSVRKALLPIGAALAAVALYLVARSAVVSPPPGSTIVELLKWFPADLAVAVRFAVAPFPLVLEYPVAHELSNPAWWLGSLGICIAAVSIVKFGRHFTPIATGMVFGAIAISPSLIALQWTGVFSPRYLYIPAVGLCLIIGYLASLKHRSIRTLVVVILLASTLGAISRTADWKDSFTLWAIEVGRSPESTSALMNLGNLQVRRGEYGNAVALQLKAAEISEKEGSDCEAAFAYSNAADILQGYMGERESSFDLFRKSVRLCPYNNGNAWLGVARAHALGGQWKEAERSARAAANHGAQHGRVFLLLGNIYSAQDRTTEAVEYFERARELAGHDPLLLAEIQRQLDAANTKGRGASSP